MLSGGCLLDAGCWLHGPCCLELGSVGDDFCWCWLLGVLTVWLLVAGCWVLTAGWQVLGAGC